MLNTCFETAQVVRDIAYYAHLVPLGIGTLLSLYVLIKNRRNQIAWIFFGLILSFDLWLLGDLVGWASNNYFLIHTFWATLDYINIIAFIFAVVFFDSICFGQTSFRRKLFLSLLAIPPFFVTLLGKSVTEFNHPFCESFENDYITYYKIFVETITIILIVITYFKVKVLQKNKLSSTKERNTNSFGLIFISLLAFLLVFSTTEYWATTFDVYEISLYGLFILPVFLLSIVISMSKQNLFNLNAYRQQIFAYLVLAMVTSQLFFLKNTSDLTLNILTILISAVLIYYLNKNIKKEIEDKKKIIELANNLEIVNSRLKELDQQKSEFISLASHQLRGPLTAIKGYGSLILEGDFGPLTPEVKEAVETMYKSTQALIVIVGDYLDVSRIEQGRMKYDFTDFNLQSIIQTLTEELGPSVKIANLSLNFTSTPNEDFFVNADQGKIKQVIGNLIDNSIKYTKQGSITISLSRIGDRITMKIQDTGVGIIPEVKPRLFEKFTRAPDASRTNIMGTGLGLYVAKKMIEAHRGRIWAESEGKDKGSTFYIELEAARKNKPEPNPHIPEFED